MVLERLFGISKPEPKESDPVTFYGRFIDFMNEHTGWTKEIYKHTYKRIIAYIGEKPFKELRFEDITVRWLKDFDRFMAKTSPSRNALNIHFRNIRAVFNDALDDEIITCYPFRKFRLKYDKTRKRSVPLESLRSLLRKEETGSNARYLDCFKLIFLLSCRFEICPKS